MKDNKIIVTGMNRKYEPNRKYGYHNHPDEKFVPKLHSELDALRHTHRYVVGSEAINIRINRSGQIRMAMPCKNCRNLLSVFGIVKVWFTTEKGWGVI